MTEKIKKTISIAIFIFLISEISLTAEPLVKPIDSRNNFILYISHLFIPVEASSTILNESNDFSINIMQSSTNVDIYYFEEHGKQGNFDLETTAVLFGYIRKIDERTEVKAVFPFYYHGGGFMDHYIENFHKLFPGGGLKNGGREFARDNEIHIQYQIANGDPNINKPFYGMGDPSFFIKRVLYQNNPGITCSLGVKPAVGNKPLINSNTTDMGISFDADYRYGIFNIYTMAGYSYFYGDGFFKEELEQFRDYMICSAIGGGILIFNSLYFSIQFYGHTSLYKTGIDKIDYLTIINSYAVRWQMNKQMVLQFCLDEDAITYAAADITFSLKCEYTF